ncbi:hypothetical protein PFISCL1PPCAC_7001, partial [Pristionchus fissidentatus]
SKITCNLCAESNVNTCDTGVTCQGNYCQYRQRVTINGASVVTRSCYPRSYAVFPDFSRTTTLNQCERKTIAGVEYAYEVCNTGDYCDTHCNGSSSFAFLLSILLLPVVYL